MYPAFAKALITQNNFRLVQEGLDKSAHSPSGQLPKLTMDMKLPTFRLLNT